jgi:integrase
VAENGAKEPVIKITNARQIDSVPPRSYTVAENLILRVKPNGSRSWVFRYAAHGKVKEIGLGKAGTKERGLGEAKELAEKMRAAVRNGSDPRTVLKPKHDPSAQTFRWHASRYIEGREADHKAGRHKNRSAKHLAQWTSTLARYAYPHIGDLLPKDIGYAHIEDMARSKDLAAKAETKYRVIQRVKVVLDEAADHDHDHSRFNPAARYLTKLKRDSRDVAHHPYAPVEAVPALYAALTAKDATSALALRWSILTACRSGEARGALWSEIDGDMWAIAATRMKAGRPHSVWLSDEAQSILEVMRERNPKQEGRIFPGPQGGLISDVAINKVLSGVVVKVLGEGAKATAHGFRTSFRTWGAEADAKFSPEALELCLAHIEANKVVAAYNRATMDAERMRILKAWSDYCSGSQDNANVVPFKTSAI